MPRTDGWARPWPEPRNRSLRDSEKSLQTADLVEAAGIEPARCSPPDSLDSRGFQADIIVGGGLTVKIGRHMSWVWMSRDRDNSQGAGYYNDFLLQKLELIVQTLKAAQEAPDG